MGEEKSDSEIIELYKNGEKELFRDLINRYTPPLFNFTARLTGQDNAPDVLQEVFIKAWKNIRGFKHSSSFQTWLFAITRNASIDWLRTKKDLAFSAFENEQGVNMLTETLALNELSPDELLRRAEDARFIKALLNELDPLYRDVLTLRYSSNMTFEAIGEILKRPLHTVKSQHRRAIIALRRSLETGSV